MAQQEKALRQAKEGTGTLIDFSGTWVNELHSVATLKQSENRLTGTYESAVSSDGKKTSGDLQGFVDGDQISFVVHWRDFQALTSWVGHLDRDTARESIKTLWQLTRQVDTGEEWLSINAGSDIFFRK